MKFKKNNSNKNNDPVSLKFHIGNNGIRNYSRNQGKGKYLKTLNLIVYFMFLCLLISSCKKLVTVPPPVNTITTPVIFADSADAVSAIYGIYNNLINTQGSPQFGDGLITFYCGSSADELIPFGYLPDFYTNTVTALGGTTNNFWTQGYSLIYQTNVCIENLQAATGISVATKNQLIGESKFFRAFFYFYLVNLYGDVPLILSSNYKVNELSARTSKALIYQQIIADLTAAQSLLRSDYSVSGGERIRANKASATALLARVYLFTGDWKNAETQATAIITDGTYSLVPNLNNVFLKNSSEAILQWQLNTAYQDYNATPEGTTLISRTGRAPNYYLNPALTNAFETGDQRAVSWLYTSVSFAGTNLIPYKYKIGAYQATPNAPATEYYMVLRLAEQYLIRAEARAELGEVNAVDDLNAIRNRAGLANYTGSATDKDALLTAIYHERQVELFAEWGHRWLDLKRTKQIDAVMGVVTPLKNGGIPWKSTQALYPIPYSDIQTDPKLVQNPGY